MCTFALGYYYHVWATFDGAPDGMVAGHVTAYQTPLSYLPKHSTSLQPWYNVHFRPWLLLPCMGNFRRRTRWYGRRSRDCIPDTTFLPTKTFDIITALV